VPAERRETVRMALARTLRGGWATAKELSRAVGLPEKEVAAHLEHLGRSGRARGERLEVEPAVCRDCGFAFRGRARLTRPGACPSCRGTHLDPPQFRLAPEEDAGG
jgi:predicted Zn-ribbon and HTH transcriptional regulator